MILYLDGIFFGFGEKKEDFWKENGIFYKTDKVIPPFELDVTRNLAKLSIRKKEHLIRALDRCTGVTYKHPDPKRVLEELRHKATPSSFRREASGCCVIYIVWFMLKLGMEVLYARNNTDTDKCVNHIFIVEHRRLSVLVDIFTVLSLAAVYQLVTQPHNGNDANKTFKLIDAIDRAITRADEEADLKSASEQRKFAKSERKKASSPPTRRVQVVSLPESGGPKLLYCTVPDFKKVKKYVAELCKKHTLSNGLLNKSCGEFVASLSELDALQKCLALVAQLEQFRQPLPKGVLRKDIDKLLGELEIYIAAKRQEVKQADVPRR